MKYNKKQIDTLVSNITIISDSREQKNSHVTDIFNNMNVPFDVRKLNYGDYSCVIKSNDVDFLEEDIDFTLMFSIERKNGLDEIIGNLFEPDKLQKDEQQAKKNIGARLRRELQGALDRNIKLYLYLEDNNYDSKVRKGTFRSSASPKSVYGMIEQLMVDYNVYFRPMSPKMTGATIVSTLRRETKKYLRNLK